jgi:hypothetical protein
MSTRARLGSLLAQSISPTDKPLDMYYGNSLSFGCECKRHGSEVLHEASRCERSLEQSLLTVPGSPLSAIVDIGVTSIMRSSVVESKVVGEYSIARRHSETVEAIVGKLQRLLHPATPLTNVFSQLLGRSLANAFQRNQSMSEAFTSTAMSIHERGVIVVSPGRTTTFTTTTMSTSSPHVQEDIAILPCAVVGYALQHSVSSCRRLWNAFFAVACTGRTGEQIDCLL